MLQAPFPVYNNILLHPSLVNPWILSLSFLSLSLLCFYYSSYCLLDNGIDAGKTLCAILFSFCISYSLSLLQRSRSSLSFVPYNNNERMFRTRLTIPRNTTQNTHTLTQITFLINWANQNLFHFLLRCSCSLLTKRNLPLLFS